jgi:outer membrane protein assembly factor BamB
MLLSLIAFASVTLSVAADTPKPQDPRPDDWPSFRGDPLLNGVATTQLPEKLELLWKFDAGEMVTSTAAIANGRVYVASLGGDLYCLDLKNGKQIWKYRSSEKTDPKLLAPGFKSSPTVTADGVYLGDEDGVFHAVDRATGKKRWTFPTGAEIVSSAAIIDSSATAIGDNIIFGSHDNSLYCLNAADGKKVWQFETQGPVNCSPAVVATLLATGKFRGSTFVTGCDEHMRVIDIETGKEQRDFPLGTYLIASPAIRGDILYVGTYASEVVALDWKTNKKVWTYKDPEREFPYHSSAAVNDKYVVVGSRDKRLHCIDRQTGKGLWMFNTRGKVDNSPVIVGDRVFFGSQDGNLYAARLSDGKELWKFTDGKAFTASPAVGENRLVIGSESSDGHVYCFGAKP